VARYKVILFPVSDGYSTLVIMCAFFCRPSVRRRRRVGVMDESLNRGRVDRWIDGRGPRGVVPLQRIIIMSPLASHSNHLLHKRLKGAQGLVVVPIYLLGTLVLVVKVV
jgi:hypothetical protein